VKNKYIVAVFVVVAAMEIGLAQTHTVTSPDGKTVVKVDVGDKIAYSVTRNGVVIVAPSTISLALETGVLGQAPKLKGAKTARIDQKITPPVFEKRTVIVDQGNELTLEFEGNWSMAFRAYNDGMAYRFVTALPGQIKVLKEEATFAFAGDLPGYLPITDNMIMSFEKPYLYKPISQMKDPEMVYLPLVLEAEQGIRIGISESALEDYPGMFLKKSASRPNSLEGAFAAFPAKENQTTDRHVTVAERTNYLAVTRGTRAFPWRLMILSDTDGGLIQSDLVYRLADPPRISDTSWIKPGKVAWDWWNANNIYGVDFVSGVNTETYKHYIDFAAEYGLEYVILDEGWSEPADLLKMRPAVDMDQILAHARQKNVRVILWVVWVTLDKQLQPALDMFQKWGIAGIKVDFMDRDDQKIVNYYWKIAEEAARRKLLVDFHGAYKPAGLQRTYPNVITREGVVGLEYSKWSNQVTPEHDVTIPFTRMLAGGMDFTPGAMVNAQKRDFRSIFERPMSQGTRCHQLAMYVVYESPVQMLSDTPSNYRREPQVMDLLSKVPTVWDETRVLDGKIADFVVIARRKGQDWYVGAMTDWNPRTLVVDFGFLGAGSFTADIWEDGVNAERWAGDYKKVSRAVSGKTEIKLAPGGGWVARIRKAAQ